MSGLPAWATNPDLLAFYERHRNRPEELYASEARFLPWLARSAASVLDVGCAAGGFSTIWRHYNPEIDYEGVDLAPALVEAARRLHPDTTFHLGDVLDGVELPDRYADVVQALGWLHWLDDHERALAELWRLARRRLFFDIRVVAEADEAGAGRQRIELLGDWDGTETPYVTLAWGELAHMLAALGPAAIYGYGYWGAPSESATGVSEHVCFATFVLERGEDPRRVCLDLPLAWPAEALPRAEILPANALHGLVPPQ